MAKRYTDKDGMYLEVFENHSGLCHLSWCDDEDGEGSEVGSLCGDPENDALNRALTPMVNNEFITRGDDGTFAFDYIMDAKRALSLANATLNSLADSKPWPQWAIDATAAGWKAPKGWKP
jgi:hypothetical protein